VAPRAAARPCLGCGRVLPPGPVPFALCRRCRGRLVASPPPGRCCRRCAAPLAAAGPARRVCGVCRRAPPAFAGLTAPWAYRPPLAEVVQALKFRRLAWVGARLAAPLAAELAARSCDCDLVVPVPLHWRRRLARGYNQAAAIARPLGRRLGLPVVEALTRRRPTPPQTALPRPARRDNPRGAFAVGPGTRRGDHPPRSGLGGGAAGGAARRRAGARSATATWSPGAAPRYNHVARPLGRLGLPAPRR
jgi:predicted amidophosphoribosyltransferase